MSDQESQQSGQFTGKVAVVTGASLGIGRATALALGQAGAKVVVNYRSSEEKADEVVAAIGEMGSQAVKHQADVADQESVEQLVARAQEEFGRLDIAISNAAYSAREPFTEANMDEFRRSVDVTMWGAFYLVRAASQQMIKNGDPGSIVVVSSPHAFIPFPNAMAYNMSKAAIEQMAKTAATELVEHKIRINLFQPGWIDTPGERHFATDEELRTLAHTRIPMGRLGTPEEIAKGIIFLADPVHEYMTGSTLLLDGGFCLPWNFRK